MVFSLVEAKPNKNNFEQRPVVYRTSDLATFDEDVSMTFIGRNDG